MIKRLTLVYIFLNYVYNIFQIKILRYWNQFDLPKNKSKIQQFGDNS